MRLHLEFIQKEKVQDALKNKELNMAVSLFNILVNYMNPGDGMKEKIL